MLRLTLILCTALYALMVIYSDATPTAGDVEVVEEVAVAAPEVVTRSNGTPTAITTADGQTLEITAVINPSEITFADSVMVAAVTTFAPTVEETVTSSASTPEPVTLVEVTGSSVNLRAGPSTGDAILASLTRGDQAELIGASGDGWALIRAVSTGVEGFMADRFLAPIE